MEYLRALYQIRKNAGSAPEIAMEEVMTIADVIESIRRSDQERRERDKWAIIGFGIAMSALTVAVIKLIS